LDASTIDLCLSVFPWAKFPATKGAVKRHVGLNHNGYLPALVTITDGKAADITVGRTLNFPNGGMVAIDKGYNDYGWYNQLNAKRGGVFFLTWLKSNAKHRIILRRPALKNKGMICDQTTERSRCRSRVTFTKIDRQVLATR
jgi:putative transposase